MHNDISLEELTKIVSGIVIEKLKTANIIPVKISNKTESSLKVKEKAEEIHSQSNGLSYQLLNKKVIVEEDIKNAIKKNFDTIEINSKSIITPSAKDMILHKKIKLIKKK